MAARVLAVLWFCGSLATLCPSSCLAQSASPTARRAAHAKHVALSAKYNRLTRHAHARVADDMLALAHRALTRARGLLSARRDADRPLALADAALVLADRRLARALAAARLHRMQRAVADAEADAAEAEAALARLRSSSASGAGAPSGATP